jgi:hypothetical protein
MLSSRKNIHLRYWSTLRRFVWDRQSTAGEISLEHRAEMITTARLQKLPSQYFLDTKIFIWLPEFQKIRAFFFSVHILRNIYLYRDMLKCIRRKPEKR